MMKQRKQTMAAFALTGLLAVTPITFAAGEHDHGDHKMQSDGMDHMNSDSGHKMHEGDDHKDHGAKMGGMFLKKKEIDGYTVTFHIMPAKPGKAMGGSHDFMIKVEKGGKALSNIVMNTKVKHPSGKSETKKTMKMGDWMMAGYDLGHAGKHQMMILFKTADGKKHKGGVYYP